MRRVIFIMVLIFAVNLSVAEESAPQIYDAAAGVEIVKYNGFFYVRSEAGCWWLRVGALDKYPVEWTAAGGYLSQYLSEDKTESKLVCSQSSIWVVADTTRSTRPVYLNRKKIGNISVGSRCYEFVRDSSFDRQYRSVDYPGGGYALCEVKFVHLLSGSIN